MKRVGARLGENCRRGHSAGRTSSGACKACNRLSALRYREKNPDAQRKASEKWRKANPERFKEHGRNWARQNPEKVRVKARRCAGLPEPTRAEPMACERCKRPCKANRSLALDHCKVTGRFRGWLCFKCNTGLGLLGDTIKDLLETVEYLKKTEDLA